MNKPFSFAMMPLLVVALSATEAFATQSSPIAPCPVASKAVASEAERAFNRRQFGEAEKLFAAMPETESSLAGRVRAKLGSEQLAEALLLAREASSGHPESALLLDALAEAEYSRGEVTEALAALKESLKIDPCLALTHYDYSLYLDLSGMAGSAQTELDTAYRLAPTNPLIRRAWKATQQPIPTPESQIADLRDIQRRPDETAAQRAEIEEVIRGLEADRRGDCEVVPGTETGSIPLLPKFGQGPQKTPIGSELEVTLNGRKRHLVLDTGATGLLISHKAAETLGLTPEAEVSSAGVGSGGSSMESVAHVKEITVGGLKLRNCKIRIQSESNDLDVEGLFGLDTLKSLLITLDLPRQQLRTELLPGLRNTPTAAASIALSRLDRSIPQGMEHWTPYFRISQNIMLPVSLGDGPSYLFVLDTGAEIGIIETDVARLVTTVRAQPGSSLRGVSGVTNDVGSAGPLSMTFVGFTGKVEEMTALKSVTGFAPEGTMHVPGFVGYDVLRTLVLKIDYRDSLIQVSPASKMKK